MMSELLIRVQDKVNADFYLDCQCTKRGDVIVARPDGWPWGHDELTAPFWRILKVPALPLAEAEALTGPELPVDPQSPGRTLRRRAFKLDLDALLAAPAIPQALKDYIRDDTRAAATFMVVLPLVAVRAVKVAKPAIADPAVIG